MNVSATAAPRFEWSDAMLVGHGAIDASHHEFVDVVGALEQCTTTTAASCLVAVQEHLLSHFEVEEVWMERLDFPAAECHVDEHRKVFEAVRKVTDLAAVGQVDLSDVKRLAKALVDWFPGHADYMDSALATWISKKTHGGSPVVLRRDLALHAA